MTSISVLTAASTHCAEKDTGRFLKLYIAQHVHGRFLKIYGQRSQNIDKGTH